MDSPTSENNIRKRVCKACDRCRLKKSKCDGASPCGRCKTDNAICVFGERKRSHDKIYPKGYVEMLEQQQAQLVAGLRELYRRLQDGESWPGSPLQEAQGGHPLTHDILERLELLHAPPESPANHDGFEEDFQKMQQRLLDNGATYMRRRGSVSSNSDHGANSTSSSKGTPPIESFRINSPFSRNGAPPTPPMNSPFPRQSQLSVPQKAQPQFSPSFIPTSGINTASIPQNTWAVDTPMMDDPLNIEYMSHFDSQLVSDIMPAMSFEQYQMGDMTSSPAIMVPEWSQPGELDFNSFVNSTAAT